MWPRSEKRWEWFDSQNAWQTVLTVSGWDFIWALGIYNKQLFSLLKTALLGGSVQWENGAKMLLLYVTITLWYTLWVSSFSTYILAIICASSNTPNSLAYFFWGVGASSVSVSFPPPQSTWEVLMLKENSLEMELISTYIKQWFWEANTSI